jgi:competence ComEA-like helix-hairpin-helix protein
MEKDSHNFLNKSIFITIIAIFILANVNACSQDQIDINSATAKELEKLTGIGPTYAQRIIDSRTFQSLDELTKVNGIGPATLNKIKEQGLACVISTDEIKTETTETIELPPESIESIPTKIDLNTATAKELEKITSVGPSTAQAIIDSRPFTSLEDLLKVRGIGPTTLEKIKEQGLAWVDESLKENQTEIEQEETENIINLKKQTKLEEKITGNVIYESKTEKIRKYSIYFFSAILVMIIFFILKR